MMSTTRYVQNVTKDTYICSVHFVGGNGPTDDYPDPIPGGYDYELVGINTFITLLSYLQCSMIFPVLILHLHS